MGPQKIVRKFAGPIATAVCGSLIFRQNLFIRKETRSDLKETRSNLKSELRAMELRLGSEIEGVKVITVGSAMATIKSLEGKKPMMEMTKGLER